MSDQKLNALSEQLRAAKDKHTMSGAQVVAKIIKTFVRWRKPCTSHRRMILNHDSMLNDSARAASTPNVPDPEEWLPFAGTRVVCYEFS